jgi:uncharacterized OsmC-like protein
MLLAIIDETYIRLELDGEDGLEIDGESFGALQMLATSLALCTAAVLDDYATTAQFVVEPFAVEVRWRYAERPPRVEHFDLRMLLGPHVPLSRHAALLRAAEHCTVHQTLTHSTTVDATLEVEGAEQA